MQLTRKQIFLAKLGACSLCVHLALLMYCFFFQGRAAQHVNFNIPTDIKFVYMPFQKRVQAAPGNARAAGAISGSDVQVAQAAKSPKTVMSKRGGKKKGGKKKAKKAKSTREKKVTPPAEPVVQKAVETESTEPAAANGPTGPIELGQQELDALEVAQSIRQEVVRVWQPPLGLAQGRQCTVKVLIDWDGMVQELHIEESSQVPAFDASVKLALRAMKFPKSVHGKELLLPFGA